MSMCAFNPTGGLYGLDKKGFSPRLCPGRLPGEQADCHIHFEDNWARGKFYAGAGGGAQRPFSCCLSPVKTIAWQDRLGTNLKKKLKQKDRFSRNRSWWSCVLGSECDKQYGPAAGCGATEGGAGSGGRSWAALLAAGANLMIETRATAAVVKSSIDEMTAT
jgi:hypothetical protein